MIKPDNEMIFSNGLHQNALNLYYTINQIAGYTPLLVACDSHLPVENRNIETPYMMVGDIPVRPLSIFYKTYQLHALLLVSVSPDPKDCRRIQQTGTKIVATSYGHKFAMAMEAMAFGNYYKEVYEGTGTPTKKKSQWRVYSVSQQHHRQGVVFSSLYMDQTISGALVFFAIARCECVSVHMVPKAHRINNERLERHSPGF